MLQKEEVPKQPQQSSTSSGHIKAVFEATDAAIAPPLPVSHAVSSGDWLASQDRFMSLANGIMQAGVQPLASTHCH